MAVQIVPTLRSSLERLKHAGAINGLCLGWRRQLLVNLLPYEDHRAERVVQEVVEARRHFADAGRDVRSLWFGYEGVHALTLFREECSLIVLHTRSADVDFLAKACYSFLEDADVLIDAVLQPSAEAMSAGDTQELTGDHSHTRRPTTNLIGRELI
jgi:hypothetical protein